MAPISGTTSAALDHLSAQVRAAENCLRRLPGSRHESASVHVTTEVRNSAEFDSYLEFGVVPADEDETEQLKLVTYFDGDIVEQKPFRDLPISARIDVAQYIKELIQLAEAAESKIAESAAEIADDLEQFLSDRNK